MPPPLRRHRPSAGALRTASMVLMVLAAPLLAELLARLLYRGPVSPPVFAQAPSGHVHLAANTAAWARVPGSGAYEVQTDARGRREPVPAQPRWWLAGDSLAFGLGLMGEDALGAQLTAAGLPTAVVAVPGYSIANALQELDRQLALGDPPEGVLILPNLADDDRQLRDPEAFARDVVQGFLIRRPAPRGLERWARSPLARSLVLQQLARGAMSRHGPAAAPGWRTAADGGAADFAELGAQIAAFAGSHPAIDLRVAWTPWSGSPGPGDAARTGMEQGLGPEVPLIDLRAALLAAGPAAFLPGDSHLSAHGSALAAAVLAPRLQESP